MVQKIKSALVKCINHKNIYGINKCLVNEGFRIEYVAPKRIKFENPEYKDMKLLIKKLRNLI